MSADLSFFWHDYETFGRAPRRDWPAQFAGVRTDAQLREIGEPVAIHCRPPVDRLPEPEACLLTGITPQRCQRLGLAEHEFAARIERELALPGTVGVGYNTIRFDDEVTRHLFWRNLIDPYAREWSNGCGRWDLLDAMRCAHALRPDGIEWPRGEDGRVSFRLQALAAANGVAHDAAHDALSDVRATIGVARRLRERQPRLFDFCLALRRKEAVWEQVGEGRPFLHVSGRYPVERGCLALVWPLGPHPTNRNELIVWDLAADPSELTDLDAGAIRARLFVRDDELPAGSTRLPIKTIHVNRSPIVVGNLKTLSTAQAGRWGLDLQAGLARVDAARQATRALAGVWTEVFARPDGGPVDVDEDLYGGFLSPADRRALERLRGLAPGPLAARHPAFEDGRLDELLFRYRARNFPDTLDDGERARWAGHCAARLHRGAGGAITLGRFLERIDELAAGADERAQELLAELIGWAEAIAPEVD